MVISKGFNKEKNASQIVGGFFLSFESTIYKRKVMRFVDFQKLCDGSFSSGALGAACGVAFGFAPASPLKSPLASRAFCSWARCSLRLLSRSWRDGCGHVLQGAIGLNWISKGTTNWRDKVNDVSALVILRSRDHHIAQVETKCSWPNSHGKALIVK